MVVATDDDKTSVMDIGEEAAVLLSRGDERDLLSGSSVVFGVRRRSKFDGVFFIEELGISKLVDVES